MIQVRTAIFATMTSLTVASFATATPESFDWAATGSPPGFDGPAFAATNWDPDGPGPLRALPVVGTYSNYLPGRSCVNLWDGSNWIPFGDGFGNQAHTLRTWDPDASGPQPAQLLAYGIFGKQLGIPQNAEQVVRWNGAHWETMGGPNVSGRLFTWDTDGDGPLPSLLMISGYLNRWWSGTQWQDITTPFGYQFLSLLAEWDFDGNGPATPQLLVRVDPPGPVGETLARWNGNSFVLMEPQSSPLVDSIVWDPDGTGPASPHLVLLFSYEVRMWNGQQWQLIGANSAGHSFSAIATWDPDDSGPIPPRLVVGGLFNAISSVNASNIAWFDATTWHPFGAGVDNAVECITSGTVTEQDGQKHVSLIAGGQFFNSGATPTRRVAEWKDNAWHSMGSGLNTPVLGLTEFDENPSDDQPPALIAAGNFLLDGAWHRIAVRRDDQWQPLGPVPTSTLGTNSSTSFAVCQWDSDGPGPQPPKLVATGDFMSAGGSFASRIAAWNGTSWSQITGGIGGSARKVLSWDRDGPGPATPYLVVGGDTAFGCASYIELWQGTGWVTPGPTLTALGCSRVHDITTWDSDADGPLPPWLVAVGSFTNASTTVLNRVGYWNGAVWSPLGIGVNESVTAVGTWDPDGNGPLHETLVISGTFSASGATPLNRLAMWNGSEWISIGDGLNAEALQIRAWNHDLNPATPDLLVVAGKFTQAGTLPVNRIAAWDGNEWLDVGGVSGAEIPQINCLAELTQANSLAVGGDFRVAGNQPAAFASWITYTPPTCPGDANNDNLSDGRDLSVLLSNFGQSVPPGTAADFNNDGIVNGLDLSVLLANFGTTC